MSQIASQPRGGFLRWAIITVPAIVLLGFLSGSVAPSGDDNPWFASLVKPAIMPPEWAFPVAWTLLYALMGLSLATVLAARGAPGRSTAIGVFVIQLALNLAWSPVFFGLHQVLPALFIIIAMVALVALTIVLFRRISGIAALLLLPYLAWICFATALNYEFHRLNPDAASLAPVRAGDQMQIG